MSRGKTFVVSFEGHDRVGALYWQPPAKVQESITELYDNEELRDELRRWLEHVITIFMLQLTGSIHAGPRVVADLLESLENALGVNSAISLRIIKAADAAENN